MGYMGFGMRKENYQRKAKKPFERVSDLYGDEKLKLKHNKNSPQLTREEVLNKPRFRGLGDLKWFALLKVAVMVILFFYALYHMFLIQWVNKKRAEWYKSSLIENFDRNQKQLLYDIRDFDEVDFISIKNDSSLRIEMNHGMQLKPHDWINNPRIIRLGGYNANAINITIADKGLKVLELDSTETLVEKEWYIIYASDTVNESYYYFLDKLQINHRKLAGIRTLLLDNNGKRIYYDESVSYLIPEKKGKFQQYQFIYDPQQKLKHESDSLIDKHMYFKKY